MNKIEIVKFEGQGVNIGMVIDRELLMELAEVVGKAADEYKASLN